MLKVINLYVLHRIFKDEVPESIKLSASAKAVYVNCLIAHFEKLGPVESNSMAFDIFRSDLQFEKFEKVFKELKKSGIVDISETFVRFKNVWGKYIDKELFNKPNRESAKRMVKLFDSEEFFELMAMKYRLNKDSFGLHVNEFCKEQSALGVDYSNPASIRRHFMFWVAKKQQYSGASLQGTVVKSRAKVLGK